MIKLLGVTILIMCFPFVVVFRVLKTIHDVMTETVCYIIETIRFKE